MAPASNQSGLPTPPASGSPLSSSSPPGRPSPASLAPPHPTEDQSAGTCLEGAAAFQPLGGARHRTPKERWWEGAVLYQVYLRSFQDSNDDGYGDLAGLLSRLPYLVSLGVDGVWLSPTMPSPDHDWGYDVSDYRAVHPELGSLADLDALIAGAAREGLAVLLDLVPNHTSDQHPWFIDASSGRDALHRDYYVWSDPDRDGGPPNNWRDATGAPAWTFDEASGQYYLHNFLPSQPDLNWWNSAVGREFEEIIRFWLDRGVAGFRIDVAHGIYKDALLRDDPVVEDAERGGPPRLKQVYSANRPETHALFRSWRRVAESYPLPRLLLGETFVLDLSSMASYYGSDDELQLCFNFSFALARLDSAELAGIVGRTVELLNEHACPVWTASNHDIGRFPTRWCDNDRAQFRAALSVLLMMPGTVVLYYGDELGMAEVDVPDALQRDPMSWHGVGGGPNRDRARTPMLWSNEPGAGFSAAEITPWLPLGERQGSVASQLGDRRSNLELCRALIETRHRFLAPGVARYRLLELRAGLWSFGVGALTVHANLSDSPMALRGEIGGTVLLSSDASRTADLRDDATAPRLTEAELSPFEVLIVETGTKAMQHATRNQ